VNNLLDKKYVNFGYMDYEPMYMPAAPRALYTTMAVDF